jgi:hypothetical protein
MKKNNMVLKYLLLLVVLIFNLGLASAATVTTKNEMLGTNNSSSSDFISSSDSPVYNVGIDTNYSNVRSWLGHSTCPSCGVGTTKEQSFKFQNLATTTDITIAVTTWFSSASATYTATITSGAGIILSGATYTPAVVGSSIGVWTIKIRPTSQNLTVKIGNGLVSGTNYLYMDSVSLSYGEVILPNTTTTPPVVVPPTSIPPSFYNSLQISGSDYPAYQSRDGLISFIVNSSSKTISAYLENATQTPRWTISMDANGGINGGLDFNSDGYPDLSVVKNIPTQTSCGVSVLNNGYQYIVSGSDGAILVTSGPFLDTCWPELNYASLKLASNSVQYGSSKGHFAFVPQYHSQGWFYHYNGGNITATPFITPLTSSFDATYVNDKPAISSAPNSFVPNSQSYYGIINGLNRYVGFASERISQFDIFNYNANQLLTDNTFKARTDIAGRTYGLYSFDPKNSSYLSNIEGTSAYSVYADLMSGNRDYDVLASIERNFILFNTETNQVQQRFYSYTHDNNNTNQYFARLVHLTHPNLPSTAILSHIMYNVYNEIGDERWTLHISNPGLTSDVLLLKNIFVWDTVDLNNDGNVEVIASPVTALKNGYYYFPDWKTQIYTWNKDSKTLDLKQTLSSIIPTIRQFYTEENAQASAGYTAQIMFTKNGGKIQMIANDLNKQTVKVDINI